MEHEEKIENQPKREEAVIKDCYKVTNLEIEALEQGNIGNANKYKEMLHQYLSAIDAKSYRELVTEYRREKFGEILRTREEVQNRKDSWKQSLNDLYKPEYVKDRQQVTQLIKDISQERVSTKQRENDEIEAR